MASNGLERRSTRVSHLPPALADDGEVITETSFRAMAEAKLRGINIDQAVNAVVEQLTEQYDVNRDGVFAKDESQAIMARLFEEVVKESPEAAALRAPFLAMTESLAPMTVAELGSFLRSTIGQADLDHDGSLSPTEIRAVREEVTKIVR